MSTIPPALASILHLPGLMYEALISLRNRLYDSGRLPRHPLSCPVISIGNITTGGTGKTPFVLFTARTLARMGCTVALLSRGYGRNNPQKTILASPGQTIAKPDAVLGDEPALIRRHLPEIWLGISKDRLHAGQLIEQQNRSLVFLLDDGFQHRKLMRDLDIVILDPTQPLENNRIFPRGTLREPASVLCRADVIIVNSFMAADARSLWEARLRKLAPAAPVFYCTQSIHDLVPFSHWIYNRPAPMASNPPRSAFLVTAIGNPERFHGDVKKMGIGVCGARSFRDHHRLAAKDWLECCRKAAQCGADAIIITEKDAVKMNQSPDFPVFVAVQTTEIDREAPFRQLLQSCRMKPALP